MARVYVKGKERMSLRTKATVTTLSLIFFAIFLLLVLPDNGAKVKSILTPLSEILSTYTTPLGRIAQKDLLSHPGVYAVVVKNLKTGETYYLNKNQEFESASLYKLWVMTVATQQLYEHKISEQQILSARKIDLDRTLELIPNTDAGTNQPSGPENNIMISYKLGDALKQMVTVSDNYAALLLVSKVGARNIDKFLSSNNFSDSSFGSPPKTTALNIAEFYEKLYDKQFISASASSQMINLLKQQKINDRIPKYLPKDIKVAHKTGELDGNKHDAGIVFSKSGDYIIVVMSQTLNEQEAAGYEANFSRDIFNYFQSKQ